MGDAMNPHIVRNEVEALKGMMLAVLNGADFKQKDYTDFCRRLERIHTCWECGYELMQFVTKHTRYVAPVTGSEGTYKEIENGDT